VSETLAIVGPVDHKSVYAPVRLKAPDYGTYWILEETRGILCVERRHPLKHTYQDST
jgi:hypothetical protein